jgi:hypothetical protein
MHNLIPVHNNMMDEFLKQKAFLEKVQSILDRERDDRIKKTPGYKKEIAAQKKEALEMEKHVDSCCTECKHGALSFADEPCNSCGVGNPEFEPKKPAGQPKSRKEIDMRVKKGRPRKS